MEKVALVTGAGGGIGKAIAIELARKNIVIAINDLIEERALETAQAVKEAGGKSIVVPGNIVDSEQIQEIIGKIIIQLGRLDILVNSIAFNRRGTLLEISEKDWDRIINVTLTGPLLITKAAIPLMRKHDGARIIHIASNGGMVPRYGMMPYCGSKAGIIMLTRSMALDLAKDGIRVNAVCPGTTLTEVMQRKMPGGPLAQMPKGLLKEYRTGIPTGRLSLPEEQAKMVAYLACDAPDQVTGQVFVVDGGQTLIS